MADPPKASSRPSFRKGRKLQITWNIATHTALRSTTRMRQRPLKVTVINLSMSNFPALPSAVVVRGTAAPQVTQASTARMATVPKTFSFASVACKAVGLPVSRNKNAFMPSDVAINMPCNAAWKDRQAMLAAAKLFVRLPKDLRLCVIEQSVPDRVEFFHMYAPRNEPIFMSFSPLAHLGDQVDRLNYTKTLLRNTVLHINDVEQLHYLHKWLASIDFAPLGVNILDNGFDAVRHLSFTDLLNHSDAYLPMPREEYNSDGTSPADFWAFAYYYWEPSTWYPVWNDCVALTHLCKKLRTLDLRTYLPDTLMTWLHESDSMAAVLGTANSEDVAEDSKGLTKIPKEHFNHPDALQIARLLDLQHLRILRILFYAPWYESTELSEEKVSMIAHWLEGRFESRGQKVKVQARFERLEHSPYSIY